MIATMSFPRRRWFDRPFDRLTVLSEVEGESRIFGHTWTPAFAGVTRLRQYTTNLSIVSYFRNNNTAVLGGLKIDLRHLFIAGILTRSEAFVQRPLFGIANCGSRILDLNMVEGLTLNLQP